MRKYNKNYFSNNENLNKNTPNTPYRKNSILKEPNLKINQKYKNTKINKGNTGNNNIKKNFKLYSSSILISKNNNEHKNHESKTKDIKSFSNSRESKNYPHSKSIFNNDYNINLSNKNNNNKKRTDYLFFFENLKIKKTQNNKPPNNEKNPDNQNKINKTQSFINNDNLSYNSFNYITNTVKNAVNSSIKKPNSKSKARPSSLLLQKKLKEENKNHSKAKPMTLLQSSKERKQKSKEKKQSKPKDVIKKNFQINTTHFNYYNNCQISNSNYFLKNKVSFNKTCTNDLYSNNSEKSTNPLIIKKKFIKNEQNNKNEEVKKSQSLSHIYHQKTKNNNIFKNNGQKRERKGVNLSAKKMLKNKTTNFNLNINNINNFNNKFLFNYNNLNKSSPVSTNKSQVINIKYPCEENKKNIFYNYINNFKFDLVNLLNNLPEEYTKDKLFIKIINLWNELGGINSSYIESFIKHTINNEDRNIIFENEISELNLIINMINIIQEKMKARNDLLTKIKSIININNNNFNEIKRLLTLLTNASMDIIEEYDSFIKEISLDCLLNKYNIERINNFNINYLSQMEKDTNFIMNNPFLNKIFNFDKNYPSLILIKNENKEINQQINKCKCSLFKYKIYQDLLIRNENYLNNPNNINLNLEKYFSNKSNNTNFNTNNNDTCMSNNSKEIKQNNEIKENNIVNLVKEAKNEQKNNELNIDSNLDKKENELNRNDILYNYNNFNSFTFGKENKLPKIKDEDILIISPYNPKKDPKLILLYTSYLSNINEKMILSFNINNDIYYYLNAGIYPKIILFKDSFSNVKAFVTLSYDHNINSDKKILTITNISCMNEYKISKILLSLIDYCRNNGIYFDSIEINLYYIKKEGKFMLDQQYENEIKNEAKFKWVKLENDGEKRKIKYHYINDNLINNNIKENRLNNYNNKIPNDINQTIVGINIINYSLIKYYQEFGYENITFSEYSQLYAIVSFLKKYYLINDVNEEASQIIENLKGIKLKKIIRILSEHNHILSTTPKDFKNDFYRDKIFDKEFLNSFLGIIEKNKNKDDDLLCLNYYNIFTNFSNIIKIEINGYEYNIISMNNYLIEAFNIDNDLDEDIDENYTNFNIYDNNENINMNVEKNKNNKNEMIYFIKSEKDDISFIFYELPENKEISDQKEIGTLFNKVLKKILVKDNEEPITSYSKICIPSFSYKKLNTEKENFEENMNDKLKIIDYELLSYFEEINFCTENLPNNEIKFSFPLSKNIENYDNIKIIKNNFVIAIINPDLVLDYHLPAMNIFYISKNYWVKKNK